MCRLVCPFVVLKHPRLVFSHWGPHQFFGPFWQPILGHVPKGKKYVFSQFHGENSPLREQKNISPFSDILTALCHSILYSCIPNFEMCFNISEPNIWFFCSIWSYYMVWFFPNFVQNNVENSQFWGSVYIPKLGRTESCMAFVTYM